MSYAKNLMITVQVRERGGKGLEKKTVLRVYHLLHIKKILYC